MNSTGAQLKAYRKKHGFTQIELSNQLGISQAEVSYYESGGRSIPEELMQAFVEAGMVEEIPRCSRKEMSMLLDLLKEEDYQAMLHIIKRMK